MTNSSYFFEAGVRTNKFFFFTTIDFLRSSSSHPHSPSRLQNCITLTAPSSLSHSHTYSKLTTMRFTCLIAALAGFAAAVPSLFVDTVNSDVNADLQGRDVALEQAAEAMFANLTASRVAGGGMEDDEDQFVSASLHTPLTPLTTFVLHPQLSCFTHNLSVSLCGTSRFSGTSLTLGRFSASRRAGSSSRPPASACARASPTCAAWTARTARAAPR